VGPFEEGEERSGVASDVVKVEGEDPATPGPLKRNDTGTITVTISQYWYNKTKQQTHLAGIALDPTSFPYPSKRWGRCELGDLAT